MGPAKVDPAWKFELLKMNRLSPNRMKVAALANSLFSPHPDFLVGLVRRCRGITQLHLPHLELVICTVCLPRENVKGPPMLGTSDPGAEDYAKVFNVKKTTL